MILHLVGLELNMQCVGLFLIPWRRYCMNTCGSETKMWCLWPHYGLDYPVLLSRGLLFLWPGPDTYEK